MGKKIEPMSEKTNYIKFGKHVWVVSYSFSQKVWDVDLLDDYLANNLRQFLKKGEIVDFMPLACFRNLKEAHEAAQILKMNRKYQKKI